LFWKNVIIHHSLRHLLHEIKKNSPSSSPTSSNPGKKIKKNANIKIIIFEKLTQV